MKKILFGLLLTMMYLTSIAQPATQKGNYSFSGYAGVFTQSTGGFGARINSFEVSTRLFGAKFIKDNLAVGGAAIFSTFSIGGLASKRDILIGPQAEYFKFLKNNERMAFKTIGIVYYANTIVSDSSANGFGIAALPGLSYFLNDNVSINGSLAFEFQLVFSKVGDFGISYNRLIFATPLIGLSTYF